MKYLQGLCIFSGICNKCGFFAIYSVGYEILTIFVLKRSFDVLCRRDCLLRSLSYELTSRHLSILCLHRVALL